MTPGLLQQFSAMTTASSSSPFQELPEDVLRRLLAGVPFLDHGATAAACRAFRAVIKGSQFLALRRRYGFEEHDIVLVGCRDPPVKVRLAHFPEKYPYNNSTAEMEFGSTFLAQRSRLPPRQRCTAARRLTAAPDCLSAPCKNG